MRKGNYLNIESSASNILSFARVHQNEAVIVTSNLGIQIADPALTLSASNMSSGNYFVTDLYNNQAMGTITINGNGGFDDWQLPVNTLASKTTRILLISINNPLSTTDYTQAELSVKLFPNPTTDEVNLHIISEPFQNGSVTIFLSLIHI